MSLGRIMLMQLSINCHIRHCWSCCPLPWVATHSSRAATRDVIGYNNFASWITVDVYNIMLMTLQELFKSCRASCCFISFYCKRASSFTRALRCAPSAATYWRPSFHCGDLTL